MERNVRGSALGILGTEKDPDPDWDGRRLKGRCQQIKHSEEN